MTVNEAKRVIRLLAVEYPNEYKGFTAESLLDKARLWAELFEDTPGEAVAAAVKTYMATDTSGFAPKAGQIREIIRKAAAKAGGAAALPEAEAIAALRRAVSNSSYHAAEEYERLPPEVRQLVGSPALLKSYAAMDQGEFESVILSHFRRDYRDLAAGMRTESKTPEHTGKALAESVRQMLTGAGDQAAAALPGVSQR